LIKALRRNKKILTRDISYCEFTKKIIPEIIKRIAILNNI